MQTGSLYSPLRAGGFLFSDGWAFHPPFSLWLRQRENGPWKANGPFVPPPPPPAGQRGGRRGHQRPRQAGRTNAGGRRRGASAKPNRQKGPPAGGPASGGRDGGPAEGPDRQGRDRRPSPPSARPKVQALPPPHFQIQRNHVPQQAVYRGSLLPALLLQCGHFLHAYPT